MFLTCQAAWVPAIIRSAMLPTAMCPVEVAQAVPASVRAKMAADDLAMAKEVATIADRKAKAAAEAEAAARAEAAAKARGEAIGSFIGGMFGGGDTAGVIDPSKVAPVPAPRLNRA